MEIKKVVNLSDEEFNLLIKSGELLGKIKAGKEAGDIDELSSDTEKILIALKEVINKLVD